MPNSRLSLHSANGNIRFYFLHFDAMLVIFVEGTNDMTGLRSIQCLRSLERKRLPLPFGCRCRAVEEKQRTSTLAKMTQGT